MSFHTVCHMQYSNGCNYLIVYFNFNIVFRGSKERVGVAVSAYMNYSNICGSRDQALDRYAMRKFLDDKIGPLRVPSHRR